ncbi:MAG: hypothetical protein R2854_07095 [Caldilineaceae bacterium]
MAICRSTISTSTANVAHAGGRTVPSAVDPSNGERLALIAQADIEDAAGHPGCARPRSTTATGPAWRPANARVCSRALVDAISAPG